MVKKENYQDDGNQSKRSSVDTSLWTMVSCRTVRIHVVHEWGRISVAAWLYRRHVHASVKLNSGVLESEGVVSLCN